jgi:aspartate kinase
LIAYSNKISLTPNIREFDALLCVGEQKTIALLSIALNAIVISAISRLAFQIGLQTCSSHGNARIKNINGQNVENVLSEKNIVIVVGFQGISKNGDLPTLGRRGPGLTALALSQRFQANKCEIYTDVDGVYTEDPKMIKNAQFIEEIDFESLLRVTFFDHKVMQDRLIAFAQKTTFQL